MRVLIKQQGAEACVRIPACLMAAASLSVDQVVEVRAEAGRIIVEPVLAPTIELKDLLARMAPETFPDRDDFGREVGEEAW